MIMIDSRNVLHLCYRCAHLDETSVVGMMRHFLVGLPSTRACINVFVNVSMKKMTLVKKNITEFVVLYSTQNRLSNFKTMSTLKTPSTVILVNTSYVR